MHFIIVFLLSSNFFALSSASNYQYSLLNVNGYGNAIEGASVDVDGNLYAVNFGTQRGTIGKWIPGVSSSLFLSQPDPALFNGIRFDTSGNMFVADVGNTRVLKRTSSGSLSTFCSDPQMLYGVPNDLELTKNGILYLSGQNWAQNTGELWRCSSSGVASRLDAMGRTNGIALSPDDKFLYLSEAKNQYGSPVMNRIWRYNVINSQGDLANKTLFFDFSSMGTGNIDVDGMRTDVDGNLYVTRNGGGNVVKLSPNGQALLTIAIGFTNPTNLAFGGSDGKTIYVVGANAGSNGFVSSFTVESAGREWRYLHPVATSTSQPVILPQTTSNLVPITSGSVVATTGTNTQVTTQSTTRAVTSSRLTSGIKTAVTTNSPTTGMTQNSPQTTSAASADLLSSCPTLGNMRCASSSSGAYQTCYHSKSAADLNWGPIQYCQAGTRCSPSGNYIYCL